LLELWGNERGGEGREFKPIVVPAAAQRVSERRCHFFRSSAGGRRRTGRCSLLGSRFSTYARRTRVRVRRAVAFAPRLAAVEMLGLALTEGSRCHRWYVCTYFLVTRHRMRLSQIMVRCARSISLLQSAEGGSLQALLCPPPSALLSFSLSLPLLELPNYTSKFPYNWSFDSGRRVPQLRTYVSRASQRFSYMYLSGAGDRASETPCADIRTRRERRMYVWNARTAAS